MADYALSRKADADIQEIASYSVRNWSLARAEAYILRLHEAFQRLAESPHLGRNIDELRKGYFRYEHESHVVFYKHSGRGILIVRVLHKSMDVKRHL